jgi:hypothetical protein
MGASRLMLVGFPPKEIHGSYWTDRGGVGQIRLTEFSKRHYGSRAKFSVRVLESVSTLTSDSQSAPR